MGKSDDFSFRGLFGDFVDPRERYPSLFGGRGKGGDKPACPKCEALLRRVSLRAFMEGSTIRKSPDAVERLLRHQSYYHCVECTGWFMR